MRSRLTADAFADRLRDELGRTVRRLREGSFMAQCPAHGDRTPSLKIDDGADKLLLRCHADCGFEDIVSAAGFSPEDLFDREDRDDRGKPPATPAPRQAASARPVLPTDEEFFRW